MGDPRFKCQVSAAQEQSSRQAFGQAAGKIGDLNVLNSLGAGSIGKGLRTLASVSGTIRTGCGSLPTTIGSTLDSGANWVLEQVGISPSSVSAVNAINPTIANQAFGQAKQIYESVKQGHFKSSDIPKSLQDLQNLERLSRNIYTPSNAQGGSSVTCVNSPYAMDLIARAPKHKFMFVVQFIFSSGYSTFDNREMAFVIKKSTRPDIKWQSEDVNYYNFRTKIITKTMFEDMNMTFHDDMTNKSMEFYNMYRNTLAPITNFPDSPGLNDPENNGMSWGNNINAASLSKGSSLPINEYTGSRGPLLSYSGGEYSDQKGVLKSIRLFHIYDAGRLMNVFQFLNPRITQMKLDDVDMAANEGNEVSLTFNYDSVYLDLSVPANQSANAGGGTPYTDGVTSLPGMQSNAIYPLRFNGSSGAMDSSHQQAIVQTTKASTDCTEMKTQNTSSPIPKALLDRLPF